MNKTLFEGSSKVDDQEDQEDSLPKKIKIPNRRRSKNSLHKKIKIPN